MSKAENIASKLDHTLFRSEATQAELETHFEQAKKYGFASVVINAAWIPLAKEKLAGSGVAICADAGTTLGAGLPCIKALEAAENVKAGADEVFVFVNMSFIKSGMWDEAFDDIHNVVKSAKGVNANAKVKVCVENGLLYEEDKQRVYLMCKRAGADYIQTNSGLTEGVATVADVRLMRETVGTDMGIIAGGHTFDLKIARALIDAGADRISTLFAVKICEQNNN